VVALLLFAALLSVPSASGPAVRLARLAPAQVLSRLERTGEQSLARDCGYSQPLPASPGRSLWLFCDTPVYVRSKDTAGRVTWMLRDFIGGSTAAAGGFAPNRSAARAPGLLSEVVTPAVAGGESPGTGGVPPGTGGVPPGTGGVPPRAGEPSPFLPTPVGLITQAGLPCSANGYPASWISGLTRIPATPELLITFNDYCVLSGSGGYVPEGFGLVEYDPATNTLGNEVTVFSGGGFGMPTAAMLLGSPVFSGPYLYLFGPACTALTSGRCATGTIFEARVGAAPEDWGDPLRYQWWSRGPSGPWTSDAAAATSIIAGARPAAVSVADYRSAGHHLVLVEQTDINGGFTVYESRSPAGPWNRVMSARVPCGVGSGYVNFCRAIIGHPELTTRTQLVLSYFDPAMGARGHVMVAGFPWQLAPRAGVRLGMRPPLQRGPAFGPCYRGAPAIVAGLVPRRGLEPPVKLPGPDEFRG
jgi:hypothetical protein